MNVTNKEDAIIPVADSRLAFVQGRYVVALKLAVKALELDSNNPDDHR